MAAGSKSGGEPWRQQRRLSRPPGSNRCRRACAWCGCSARSTATC